MPEKSQLLKEFSKDYKKYYYTDLFEEEGFQRKKCRICGKGFWTADPDRELCGDSEHEPYSFMKAKPTAVKYGEFWSTFADFFKKRGHSVAERYPVVSRWRQDLYFTIASIQDFQRIENGRVNFEYPSNPLIVPQMCLRFNDVPNVGVTGRHFTSFMMAGQLAFNYPKEGYWRNETIRLNYDFLTTVLKVKKEALTYTEDLWAMGDFSEFGPCIESFANGLELVNSVFTEFEYSSGKISELKGKVVDVGWGFERLMWYASGAQTAYDPVFSNELKYLYGSTGVEPNAELYAKVAGKLAEIDLSEEDRRQESELEVARAAGISEREYNEIILPNQALYAIADHARTFLFAINDGALPSNVGGGYNLRILLRRIFDFSERYKLKFDMQHLMEITARDLKSTYGDMAESIPEAVKIIELERSRYSATRAQARRIVGALLEKSHGAGAIDAKTLNTMYESNGITPEFISAVAAEKGIKIKIPETAYSKILKGDFVEKEKRQKKLDIVTEGIKPTEKLFYSFAESAEATVIKAEKGFVVLDRTPFYAESGGQEADHGRIGGLEVTDVQNIGGVIVHEVKGAPLPSKGSKVHCEIDRERRLRLMAHHTATHLVSAAARAVLGQHAWQEGAKKSAAKAHIDIAHYEKLSDKQVKEIESTANGFILHGIKVTMHEMKRKEAELSFGFSIYQGHGVPSGVLRIVEIRDLDGKLIDAEACGGLHLMGRESEIGLIKITGSYRIHDGIDRIEYVAGIAAEDYIKGMEASIGEIAGAFGADASGITPRIKAKLAELEKSKSSISELKSAIVSLESDRLLAKPGSIIVAKLQYGRQLLRAIATRIADSKKDSVALLFNPQGDAVAVSGSECKDGALDFVGSYASEHGLKFTGGGSRRMAEGRLA